LITYPGLGGSAEFGAPYPTYNIDASTTTISAAAVTPSNSVVSASSAYNISFHVGTGGYLTSSSSITLKFPGGTTIPVGAISGVTVNSTTTSAVGSGDSIIVDCPFDVPNNGSVQINIPLGAGMQNPSPAGTYSLDVYTSSESTPVTSEDYYISDPSDLSFTSVELTDSEVNALAGYTMSFVVSSSGALSVNDSIIVRFQNTTVLPSTISKSKVIVTSGGFSASANAVIVSEDTIVTIATPISVSNSAEVELEFLESIGIQNPAIAGNYRLSVETETSGNIAIDSEVSSNAFSISSATSTHTSASVTLDDPATSAASAYTLRFSVGSNGRLVGGLSNFNFAFPSGTTLPASTTVNINGVDTTATSSSQVLTVPVPYSVNIENNDTVNVQISGITNPGTEGTYSISSYSSVEQTEVVSNTYGIGSSLTVTGVTLVDPQSNEISAYTISATDVSNLDVNDGDYINVVFPEGVTLPASISITGGQTVNTVSVNQSTRTVKIFVDRQNKDFSSIAFLASAGIQNPSVPSSTYYKVFVSTSKQQALVASPVFIISPQTTSVGVSNVTATPAVTAYSGAAYEIPFTPGVYGRLTGGISGAGSDTVIVYFDAGTIVPASISAGDVSLNSQSCSDVSVITSGSGGSVAVVVPDGLEVPASTQATLYFTASAGLQNGSAGTYTVQLRTSVETSVSVQTGNLEITSSADLGVTEITNSPTTINAQAAYSIKFMTGSLGALSQGQDIVLDFSLNAGNTYIPATIDKSLITVNGSQLLTNASCVSQVITLQTPVAIGNVESVTVSISSNAGILNSTTASTTNTISVSTSAEAAVTSPQFTTSAASSTISSPSVSLSDYNPSTSSTYTIEFNTGNYGRLIESASTITLTFPSGTGLGTISSATINSTTASRSVSGQELTLTLPSISIGNNAGVSIEVQGITNPASTGNYTLKARTSVETSNVTSSSYPITNVTALTIDAVSFITGTNTDTVNMAGGYSIDLSSISPQLDATSGSITIEFPSGTVVPVSISTANVTVDGAQAYAVTTNSGDRTVTVTVPTNLSGASTLEFSQLCNIINPRLWGDKTLRAWSSEQPSPSTSPSYTVAPSGRTIYNLDVYANPQITDQALEWTWVFNVSGIGGLVSGTSTLNLLYNADGNPRVTVPFSINNSYVTVNGVTSPAVNVYPGVQTEVEVTLPSSVTVNNNDQVVVVISQAAGITSASTSISTAAYTSVDITTTTPTETALPVELTSYTLENADNVIKLNWQTATEVDNLGFILERSTDPSEGFVQIASYQSSENLKGQGTVSEATNYSYLDYGNFQYGETYYYRLSDIDITGKKNVLETKSITRPEAYSLQQNYPNPFNPVTTIQFSLQKEAKTVIEVYDILGRKVATLLNKQLKAGAHVQTWDARNYASGVYFYRLQSGSFTQVKKMMLLK